MRPLLAAESAPAAPAQLLPQMIAVVSFWDHGQEAI